MDARRRLSLRAVSALVIGLSLTLMAAGLLAAAPVEGVAPGRPITPSNASASDHVQAASQLPVFHLTPPLVNTDSALVLANRLGIGAQSAVSDTHYLGSLRLSVPNTVTGLLFEQFGASGGFFAFNASRAFSETDRGILNPDNARMLACSFLQTYGLFPNEMRPQDRDCASTPPYEVIIANETILTPTGQAIGPNSAGAVSTTVQTAIIVRVPLNVNVGAGAPVYLPLRGPGGHLSLLFTSTDPQMPPSLNNQLAALAVPWYGQQLQVLGMFDVIPLGRAIQQAELKMRSLLPAGAQAISAGTPELAYYAGDPAAPQPSLIPTYVFTDPTAIVDGITVTMKSFTEMAVSGFAPVVTITSPTDGSTFTPGQPVSFTGIIMGGFAPGPYTYTLSLDDGTPLKQGSAPSGTLLLTDVTLPVDGKSGTPISVTVHLAATDSNAASGEAIVTVRPSVAPVAYVPLVQNNSAGGSSLLGLQPSGQAGFTPSSVAATYRVGAEYVQNYNGVPGLGNLSLTGPDAIHFYNGLVNYGWSGSFLYGNNAAWEKDWRDCSLGGGDCSYGVDRVDFAYFSGHGSPSRIYFGTYKDSTSFWGGNARYQNLRWAGFSSCRTIRAETIGDWFNAFQGAHMLLGFYSTMGDVDFGSRLVDNMRIPSFYIPFFGYIEFPSLQRLIREAWVQTAFEMNAGRPSYIYAVGNGVDASNDRLPKGGDPARPRPYPVQSWHWVWWYLPGD